MDFWEWLQRTLGAGRQQEQPMTQSAPPASIRRNWNEQLSSNMARTPPISGNGSLKDAIWSVLSGSAEAHARPQPAKEIASEFFGGQQNPVILDDMVVTAPPNLDRMQHLLDSLGYLPQQRRPDWNEEQAKRVFNATSAYGGGYYGNPQETVARARELLSHNNGPREINPELAASEDAWALYLGLPQHSDTWQVSPYTPQQSKDPSTVYLRSPEIWYDLLSGELQPADWNPSKKKPNYSPPDGTVRRLLELAGPNGRAVVSGGALMDQEGQGPEGEFLTSTTPFALADFTITVGSDERGPYISIYDIWDLDKIPGADNVGKPFEIYDRLYFDPTTFQPIWDERQPQQRRRRFPSRQ
jgi:hypothetical protein